MEKSNKVLPLLVVCGLLSFTTASADQITKPHTFTPGTPAKADEVNNDFDVVYGQVNKIGSSITVDDSKGFVGIGTVNPKSTLEVNGIVSAKEFKGPSNWKDLTNLPPDIVAFATDGLSCTDGQVLKYKVGSGWICGTDLGASSQDNLGNHIATQNIILGSNYLSGDGGNEGIMVNATGNVGVGTNAPSARLEIIGQSSDSGSAGLAVKNSSGGSSTLYVRNDGMVGIGTNWPIAKLTVAGAIMSTSGGVTFPDFTVQTSAAKGDGNSLDSAASGPTDKVDPRVKTRIHGV